MTRWSKNPGVIKFTNKKIFLFLYVDQFWIILIYFTIISIFYDILRIDLFLFTGASTLSLEEPSRIIQGMH